MFQHTIAELSQLLQSKNISSVELTRAYIERCESLAAELNCFITLTPELALQQAKDADDRIQSGTADALTGVPIAHKDIFCSKNTELASKIIRCGIWCLNKKRR